MHAGLCLQLSEQTNKEIGDTFFIPVFNIPHGLDYLKEKVRSYLDQDYVITEKSEDLINVILEDGCTTVSITLLRDGESIRKEEI